METWRLIDVSCGTPERNLALEEAVARSVASGEAQSTLRFWTECNAVIVGRCQDPEREVNAEACGRHGTAVAKRFTGGGAVYQDQGNLNWAVSLRKDHPLVRSSRLNVTRAYRILIAGVVEGLNGMGVAAHFVPPSDLRIRDRKVSGVAGAMRWGGIFFTVPC